MNSVLTAVKLGLSAIIGFLGWFLGGFDTMLITLLIFIVIDYISGVINAIYKKKLCSSIGFKGILRKVLIILLVGSVNLLGVAINMDSLRYMVIAFYLANEGISIIENAAKIGVPVPQKIIDVLEQLREDDA